MLYELYQHLSTPCPRPVRKLGYLREMIGMAARQRRCRAAWQSHLEQCRDWIVQAMDQCRGRERVVILGSGLLNDVPLKALSQGFAKVDLVDILHMPAVRKTARMFANVELHERDISGLVDPLYRHWSEGAALKLPVCANMPVAMGEADLVISLNVVSQIPVLPQEFAGKNNLPLEADLPARLIRHHLDALSGCAGRVCLITEVEQRLCQDAKVIETADPLAGVAIPQGLKASTSVWSWNFAPRPERHPRYDLVYRVEASLN